MSEGTVELPFLVEKLNAPPFNLNESIVTLSEKIAQSSSISRSSSSGQAGGQDASTAHQLLSDVFARISPKTHPPVNVKNETIEETVRRITTFLKQVKCFLTF